MSEFVASNGIRVENFTHFSGLQRIIVEKNGNREIDVAVTADVIKALVEALDHERDEELGRWRYPADPRYVVYGGFSPGEEKRLARIVNEQMGVSNVYYEGGHSGQDENEIAIAYFDAHPRRKPREDAQPGDIWVVSVGGEESFAVHAVADILGPVVFKTITGRAVNMSSSAHTGARKIWPEDAS